MARYPWDSTGRAWSMSLFQAVYAHDLGTLQQYTVAIATRAAKIPGNISFDEAATLPSNIATAAIGIYGGRLDPPGARGPYQGAGYTAPWTEGGIGKYKYQPIVVIGGSSSVGQYAIQLAKLSGFNPIITTASTSNEEYCKRAGATHVIDYHATPYSALPAAVSQITTEPVELVYAAISSEEAQRAALEVVAKSGYVVLTLPPTIGALGERSDGMKVIFVMGSVNVPENYEFGDKMYAALPGLLARGDIKPNRTEVLLGGLAGAPAGVERLANNSALSHWFRNNGNGSGSKKPHDGLSKKFDTMVDMAPEKPRHAHADQFFSTKQYNIMVKDCFDAHFCTVTSAWAAAQAIPQQPGVEGLPSEDQLALLAGVMFEGDDLFQDVYDNWCQSFVKKGGKLVEVTLRAAFTHAVYHSQSDEFKKSLKQELDSIYDKAMDTYRQLLDSADAEKTPEYYHEMQSKAPHYLYPFAEHMSKRLGMNVSIMVYGPISAQEGAISVKSIHVGTTNDPASLEWMDAKPEACEAMVKSMCAFGEQCFTPEEHAACSSNHRVELQH
ncbi:hypothetical protein EWM64_g7593 [Hericium alpestre]|uniref:Alcohol dehydrogenase-like C-terminal domain-containing protein n=1 Tax=Hericium alpestre TaxID=135208 RepID=A0A4Y9ZSF1_9AGAM|nr:hypothetical protein EWM64_g7593 [Hericium alpestre]